MQIISTVKTLSFHHENLMFQKINTTAGLLPPSDEISRAIMKALSNAAVNPQPWCGVVFHKRFEQCLCKP